VTDASPRCTYRLQLSRDFTFEAAASRARYLASLGVSHVYSSPFLQAAPASTHGYDVVDPHTINKELGGEPGFHRFMGVLRKNGLGVLMDVVPNHMATAGRANPWWWDLLQHGKSSPYAGYFDIDWEPPMSHLKGKVLLGVLADRYGRELEAGRLVLDLSGEEATVRYQGNEFPISRDSLDGLAVDGIGEDLDALDALLQRQHYRLAYWRTAQEELNYRRFFTVDSLIGLRVELEQVLKDSHRLVFELLAGGDVAGLRVDHVDGLLDPESYLTALRSAAPDAYLVVEKVLAYDESLPASFPVQGTTGYDFIAHVDGVFVNSENEQSMTTLYHAFTGESLTFAEVVRTCKNETMVSDLAPDLERLTALLVEICDRYRNHRDRTRRELQDAIREVAAALSVYRTYVRPGFAGDEDRRRVASALDQAARRAPEMDPELLAFVLRHADVLRRCSMLATERTGRLLIAETGLRVECMRSGPNGGYAQVAARVVMGEVDAVVFLVDPLDPKRREPDLGGLLRACNLYDVPLATNPMSARLLLTALFEPELIIR